MSTPLSPVFTNEAASVIRQLSGVILEYEPRLPDEDNVEPVHEVRVALNKLRVALRLLPQMTPKKLSKQMQSDLKWFKDALAPVRDEDVIIELVPELGDPPYEHDRPGIEAILHALREERQEHLEELRRAMQSSRYEDLKAGLEALRKKMRSRKGKTCSESEPVDEELLAQNLAELIHPLQQDLEGLRRQLSETFEPTVMHQLRISAKKFRYALDFFKDLRPDLYPPLSDTLHELHDCTGKMHDMDVLAPKVESLAAHWQMTQSASDYARIATGIEWVLFRLYVKRRELMNQFYGIWATIAEDQFRARVMAAAGAENVILEPQEAEM